MKKEYIEITQLKDKQRMLIKLLAEFHDICQTHGLVYNIFGGTMLGAIRHKGIIPWDDDIDITMPRIEYNKFVDIIRTQYKDKYIIHVFPDTNYIYPYAKFGIIGTELYENAVKAPYNKLTLNMDIFPNDGYPNDESIFNEYNECEKSIILKTYRIPRRKNPIKQIYVVVDNIIRTWKVSEGIEYYIKKQIDLLSATSEEGNDYIVCQGAGWGKKGKLEKNKYYDRVLYDFNDIKVWGIRDYHQHLTNLYGDYMTPPPVDKRHNPHDSKLYISKAIYEKYLEVQV